MTAERVRNYFDVTGRNDYVKHGSRRRVFRFSGVKKGAELFNGAFLNPRDIRSGNAKLLCDFPLRQDLLVVKPVTEFQDKAFPL